MALTSARKVDISAMRCGRHRVGGHDRIIELLVDKGADVNA
jgi:hypothetical protein